jgi:hypothetical protein
VRSDGVEEVRRRYFHSVIHFCRSTPGCWDRKAGEEEDIGKIRNILRSVMSEAKKVEDKKRGNVNIK